MYISINRRLLFIIGLPKFGYCHHHLNLVIQVAQKNTVIHFSGDLLGDFTTPYDKVRDGDILCP